MTEIPLGALEGLACGYATIGSSNGWPLGVASGQESAWKQDVTRQTIYRYCKDRLDA